MPALSKPMLGRGTSGRDLKEALGNYVRSLRETAGLTQADLAKAVDIKHYAAISAIENGRNVVPPERYLAFAKALNVPHAEFMKEVLKYTNPWAFILLFSERPDAEIKKLNLAMNTRLAA